MKRLGLLVLVAIAAAWLFFMRSPHGILAPPPLVLDVTPAPKAPIAPAPAKIVVKKFENTPPTTESNRIKFKVVDGMAVAFGDLILGEPEHPDLLEGYYDAPRPQLWDTPEIPYLIHPDLPDPSRVHQALDYLRRHSRVNF